MIFKIIIVAMLFFIVGSLASAMFHMVNSEQGKSSDKVLKSLTWRIGLSALLFILLFIGQWLGLISPHSLS